MRYVLLCIALAVLGLPATSKADTCSDHAWIPETEHCLGFGAMIRLNILRSSVDEALGRLYRPSFYKIVVIRSGRSGAESDSFVSDKPPTGMEHEWFATFYVYMSLEYLAERSGYPSLTRVGAQRVCESGYISWPEPSTAEKAYVRREKIEACVYDNMRDKEEYYFVALRREIELGDEYLAQFTGMSYQTLRDTIRGRFGDPRSASALE